MVPLQARRTPLIQAVIHASGDVVVFILSLPYKVNVNAQDMVNIIFSSPDTKAHW